VAVPRETLRPWREASITESKNALKCYEFCGLKEGNKLDRSSGEPGKSRKGAKAGPDFSRSGWEREKKGWGRKRGNRLR